VTPAGSRPGPPEPDAAPEPALERPGSPGELLRAFHALALQGFGGVLPVAQRELVERRRWLSASEFLALLSLSQVLPGPNIVNMGLMIGQRFFGWRGALAAVTGLLAVPLLLVLTLAVMFAQAASVPAVAGALRGMGIVAAGLVLAMGVKLAAPLRTSPLGRPVVLGVALLAFLGLGVWRWSMVTVVLGLGGASVAWAFWRLRRRG
jgi:chromate transporter